MYKTGSEFKDKMW